MTYNFQEFFNTNKPYISRWGKNHQISTPDYSIPQPLEQCQFVMTRVDRNKKSFPVDMWGKPVDPKIYGTALFSEARPLWVDGSDAYFDGYSVALPDVPNPVYLNVIDKELYVVAGVYENCVTRVGNKLSFSNELTADWISLGKPTRCLLPSKTGVCWIGLSSEPIQGGIKRDKQIDSRDFIVPITNFIIDPEDDKECDDWDPQSIKLLPPNAQQIINKILAKGGE
jgi:hypothetical protein